MTRACQGSVLRSYDIAAARGERDVGPEHMLLGILADQGPETTAFLAGLSLSVDALRQSLEGRRGPGDSVRACSEEMGMHARGRRALDYMYAEYCANRGRSIGIEHLLLGIAREPSGLAAQELLRFGFEPEMAREVLRARRRGAMWRIRDYVAR